MKKMSQFEFILIQGILKEGLGFAVFITVGFYFFDNGFTFAKIENYISNDKTIFLFFCNFLFWGLYRGVGGWNYYQEQSKQINEINK